MRRFIIATAILAAAVSCTEAGLQYDNTITCSVESVGTRTSLAQNGDHYDVQWLLSDKILVRNASGEAIYKADNTGTTTTTFSKWSGDDITGGGSTAYYPVTLADGLLPDKQTYVDGNICESPMIAYSDNSEFAFRNICGILCLNLSTSEPGVKVACIKLSADQGLSGEYSIIDGAAAVTAGQGLTLDCGKGVAISTEAKPFHFSVPAGDYTGFSITVLTTDGRKVAATLAPEKIYRIERSKICALNFTAASFSAGSRGAAVLRNGADVNELIKKMVHGSSSRVSTSDTVVRKIVFKTDCVDEGSVIVSERYSEEPVYASYDKKTYTVTISTPAAEIHTNDTPGYMFYYFKGVETIENLKCLNTENGVFFNNMFHMSDSISKLKELDLSHFNTEKAVTMKSMFCNCSALTSLDVSGFKTDNVSYFTYMFRNCSNIKNLDISNFTSPRLISFAHMFRYMKSLETLNLSGFNISLLTDTSYAGYAFEVMPSLKELRLGENGYNNTSFTPTNFFCAKAQKKGTRTASNSGSLTVYCTQAGANWLSKTNLRWIKSGYNGQKAITVKFVDISTGADLKVTWAAN